MINEKMRLLGTNRSTIRELFEYGKKMKRELGEDAVFDYSLGNPSVEPPFEVNDTLISLAKDIPSTELHGYTSAEGDITVRRKIAEHIESSFDVKIDPSLIYMTAGAAAALTSVLSAVTTPGESVIVISPFFPEYKVFVEATGAALKTVKAREGAEDHPFLAGKNVRSLVLENVSAEGFDVNKIECIPAIKPYIL